MFVGFDGGASMLLYNVFIQGFCAYLLVLCSYESLVEIAGEAQKSS